MLLLFTASSIYHGLEAGRTKLKMRIFDRCAIYILTERTDKPQPNFNRKLPLIEVELRFA
jgi:hypothetical protein